MNKKAVRHLSFLDFRLIDTDYSTLLDKHWNYRDLSAPFWRLYSLDRLGAGILCHGQKIDLVPGNLYLIPPNVPFGTYLNSTLHQLIIHFMIPPFSGPEDTSLLTVEITPVIRELIEQYKKSRTEKNIDAMCLFAMTIAAYALSRLPAEALVSRRQSRFSVSRLCGIIQNFYRVPLTIRRMMELTGYNSKHTLNRHFFAETDMTPHQYLMHQRYDYAAELLRDTTLTLAEIADAIYVNDPFHLSKTFKKLYGLSPRAYRNKFSARSAENAKKSGK